MPHAYWRLTILANNGSTGISIAEVQMRATVGGADQCSGGTASASGVNGGFVASNAFDDVSTTLWNVGTTTGWIQYQFASPVDVAEYAIQSRHDGFPNDAPRDWLLAFSDNGTTWTDVQKQEQETAWTASQLRTFPVGVPGGGLHRTWRLTISANNGSGNTSIGEMEMHATVGGADQCTGGVPKASAVLSTSYDAAKAFDNSTTTLWNTPGTGWLQYARTPFLVAEYTIRSRHDGFPGDAPRDWTCAFTDDGLTWTTVDTRTSQTSWTTGQTRTFTTTLPVVLTPQPHMQVVA